MTLALPAGRLVMGLLFGIVGILAVGCLAVFLVALRRERPQITPRNINIYIAQETRPALHKVAARYYGPLTVIEGGSATSARAEAPVRERIVALKTPDALRQGSGYRQGA